MVRDTGLDIPIHVDAASGGFIAPFLQPELDWDFRVRRVCSISTSAHSGTYAGQAGSTSPTNGDSSIAQTFTAPSGSSSLTFWYAAPFKDPELTEFFVGVSLLTYRIDGIFAKSD